MENSDTGSTAIHRYVLQVPVLVLATVFLLHILAACATASPPIKQTTSQAQQGQSKAPVEPIPTLAPSALHGPTNFMLSTPLAFSSVNGTTTDSTGARTVLDAQIIKNGITHELQRFLFVVNSLDEVNVYLPGTAAPTQAQVTQRSDGSTALAYNNSANSIKIRFSAALYKDQIIIKYEQTYTPLITENANASAVEATFTTHIRWIAANQIPTAPYNGQYQITKEGTINLSWKAGHNAVAYHIYRIFPDQEQQFQMLSTVKNTSYHDRSAQLPKKLSIMGIAYAIFSVGPTGIENPTDVIIAIAKQ